MPCIGLPELRRVTCTFESDEDILTYTVSDEALEAAAGNAREATLVKSTTPVVCCYL